MTEISDALRSQLELTTQDIAIAAYKLNELAGHFGGRELANHARREVKKLEYRGVSTLEAIRQVYHLVAKDKF